MRVARCEVSSPREFKRRRRRAFKKKKKKIIFFVKSADARVQLEKSLQGTKMHNKSWRCTYVFSFVQAAEAARNFVRPRAASGGARRGCEFVYPSAGLAPRRRDLDSNNDRDDVN